MRLARLLGKLRGPCLRLAFRRVRERRHLLGILVNDSPNEFHTFLFWRGLSGAGCLAHTWFWFLILGPLFLLLGLYRSFLGHPFNSLPVRQSFRHGIIRFSGSPDRTSCVPIRQAGLYQIYRGHANRFDSFWKSAHTNRPMASTVPTRKISDLTAVSRTSGHGLALWRPRNRCAPPCLRQRASIDEMGPMNTPTTRQSKRHEREERHTYTLHIAIVDKPCSD